MNRICWLRFVEVICQADAAATFNLHTDVPGPSMALAKTAVIGITTGRQAVRLRLPGTARARMLRPEIIPSGGFRLYGVRVFLRVLPGGDWQWVSLPVVQTPEAWVPVKLPIPQTPEEFAAVKLPIPETPEQFTGVPLPIDPTEPTTHWVAIPPDVIIENA